MISQFIKLVADVERTVTDDWCSIYEWKAASSAAFRYLAQYPWLRYTQAYEALLSYQF